MMNSSVVERHAVSAQLITCRPSFWLGKQGAYRAREPLASTQAGRQTQRLFEDWPGPRSSVAPTQYQSEAQ